MISIINLGEAENDISPKIYEDPFVVSHDLGRVVDKFSIKVLREVFERAADVIQYDPNPWIILFEPYVPG
ncbi:hypothetical protein GOBAR_AA17263 [Gossypium barbadense]|uniref:Uncharacterized protein n=1 Tax=Gossypium barbadense TaxID=3634 RepID=A0A2P5XJA0_GOSBA|nr:hypothetical protein GOBAR_AA17263 [Gossypium barbadense]